MAIRAQYETKLAAADRALFYAVQVADELGLEGERGDLMMLRSEVGRLMHDTLRKKGKRPMGGQLTIEAAETWRNDRA
jgi:hypothetical protein